MDSDTEWKSKPTMADYFKLEHAVPIKGFRVPNSLTEGLTKFDPVPHFPPELPEPTLTTLFIDQKLEFFSLPSGIKPEQMILSALPRLLDRYAYMSVGLRFLLGGLDYFLERCWDGEPLVFPALESPLVGYPDRIPAISLWEANGGILRKLEFPSRYASLKGRRWMFPAIPRFFRV